MSATAPSAASATDAISYNDLYARWERGNWRATELDFSQDVVDWNELYLAIAKTLGKKRRLAHVPIGLARAGARATQWLPGAPLTTDQIAMIEAGDNVVSGSDAVDTFQLSLVPLEEQLRRAA